MSDEKSISILRPLAADRDTATLDALLTLPILPGSFQVWRYSYISPFHRDYTVPCSAMLALDSEGDMEVVLFLPHEVYKFSGHFGLDDMTSYLGLSDIAGQWTRDTAEEQRRTALAKRNQIVTPGHTGR